MTNTLLKVFFLRMFQILKILQDVSLFVFLLKNCIAPCARFQKRTLFRPHLKPGSSCSLLRLAAFACSSLNKGEKASIQEDDFTPSREIMHEMCEQGGVQ